MKLPGGADAIVSADKLREYCLNAHHPRGKHKARVFASRLGLAAKDAEALREALEGAARDYEAIEGSTDAYGTRYTVDFEMATNHGRGTVRSVWLCPSGGDAPRLLTCYVL